MKKPIPYSNGLTAQQVKTIRDVLSKVNVSAICRKTGTDRHTIENVLNGKSPQVADLKKILSEAKKQIKKKEKVLNSLPL